MRQFVRHFVIPIARTNRWTRFCEIGASTGRSTDEILKLPVSAYTVVDPCFDADLSLKYAGDTRVTVRKCNSLDALPDMEGTFDCILIDGDHNWYTVFNELRLIRERNLLRPGGMVFFHDVGWPYGRRDMYYQPETIPAEYRQRYEPKGIIQGSAQLADHGAFGSLRTAIGEGGPGGQVLVAVRQEGAEAVNGHLCNAVRQGGPRNGVLTAIEDFVAEHPSDYDFCMVRVQCGLGILQYRGAQAADNLSFFWLRMKAALYLPVGLVLRLLKM
jgi:SAM-dependent methyltransferase